MADGDVELKWKTDISAAIREIAKLTKEIENLRKKEKKGSDESKKAAKEEILLKKKAAQVTKDMATPQEKYNTKMKELNKLLRAGHVNLQTYGRATARARDEMDRAGKSSRAAFGPKALAHVKSMAGALGVGFGVAGAVSAVNKGYEVWKRNIREIAAEANKAAGDIIAMAALQEGGTKAARVGRAAELGARYGVARGEAFQTVQAMQSALGGDFEKGMVASRTIFAASQMGVPIEHARELELVGTSLGQAPGVTLRQGFAAGQLSKRDPALLATASPGLAYWKNKVTGFASAATLAGQFGGETSTFLKASGEALGQAGPLQKKFARMGMGDASQLARIQKLAEMGIDEPAELKKFGISEKRAVQAVSNLVKNVTEVVRLAKEIPELAQPGVFASQQAAVEAELPGSRLARQSARAAEEAKRESAFGKGAIAAQSTELLERSRAIALRRMGVESAGPFGMFDVISEEGRTTRADWMQAKFFSGKAWVQRAELERDRVQFALSHDLPLSPEAGQWPVSFDANRRATEVIERGRAEDDPTGRLQTHMLEIIHGTMERQLDVMSEREPVVD